MFQEKESAVIVVVSLDGAVTVACDGAAREWKLENPFEEASWEVTSSEIIQSSGSKCFLAIAASSPSSAKDFWADKLTRLVILDISGAIWDANYEGECKELMFSEHSTSLTFLKSVSLSGKNQTMDDLVLLAFDYAKSVRCFLLDRESEGFSEVFVPEFFPEFQEELKGSVLHFEMQVDSDGHRWSIWGCDNGRVDFVKVDVRQGVVTGKYRKNVVF